MSKAPRFLIAEDQRSAQGRVFVLHTKNPQFLAEITGEDESGCDVDVIAWYADRPTASRESVLVNQLSHWYMSYMDWDDDNIQRDTLNPN